MNFNLPPDIIVLLALELDMPTILNYCLANSKFNSLVCESQSFWRRKYEKDFFGKPLHPNMNAKNFYRHIHNSLMANPSFLPIDPTVFLNEDLRMIHAAAKNNSLDIICQAKRSINILCRNEDTFRNLVTSLYGYIRGNIETYKEKYYPQLTWRQFYLIILKTPSILQKEFF